MGSKAPNPAPNRLPDGSIDKTYVKPPAPPSPPLSSLTMEYYRKGWWSTRFETDIDPSESQ